MARVGEEAVEVHREELEIAFFLWGQYGKARLVLALVAQERAQARKEGE